MKKGFDNQKYLKIQRDKILKKLSRFKGKLYLEFGGKLLHDYHASRVLPGYDPNVKLEVLKSLRDNMDIIFCVSAQDIEGGRIRGDFGITYDNITLKSIQDLEDFGLKITAISINMFTGQPKAELLRKRLETLGYKVYCQPLIEGYPTNIEKIISNEGYGKNTPIETEHPLVVVSGAGPGSGKMSICLAQIYLDKQNGLDSGYAKWETFPIWNIPLKHPVNIAYEAATANIGDYNLVDPFHLEAYGKTSINYNRDVESFSIIINIIKNIISSSNPMSAYKSPTDMGVNACYEGIINEEITKEAARQEIIRRWFRYNQDFILGIEKKETLHRMTQILAEADLRPEQRKVVEPAQKAAEEAKEQNKGHKGIFCGAAMELPDGSIVTGNNSPHLHAESSVILNGVKKLAGIPDNMDLLPIEMLEQIRIMKSDIMGFVNLSLNLNETLIALSTSALTNTAAKEAMKKLKELNGCKLHVTHMPTQGDEKGLRDLKLSYTTDGQLTLENFIGI